ncbi:2-arachidonoylglycerol hydrolase ABHD12 [Aphelenchoides besseyi]|nr:2-arachidonoylglycerol hydrolase ABHD12 [Aphelenchoides besseyi]
MVRRPDASSPPLATARCSCQSPGENKHEVCTSALAPSPLGLPITARPISSRIVNSPKPSQLATSLFWRTFIRVFDRLNNVTVLEVSITVSCTILATMCILHFCVHGKNKPSHNSDSQLTTSLQKKLDSTITKLISIFFRAILVILGTVVMIYVVLPLGFFLFPSHAQHVFFLNFLRAVGINYSDLRSHGIKSPGRNFYIQGHFNEDVVEPPILGVWHILPARYSDHFREKIPTEDDVIEILSSTNDPVIVYYHGNSYDRTSKHRCQLYQTLSEQNFHVFSIDYRGFGDSTGLPTEGGVIRDALTVYQYVLEKAKGPKKLIVWGHSMGSGVAIAVSAFLCQLNTPPYCVVLESAFNNLRDAMTAHPYSIPYRQFPLFDFAIVRPLIRAGLVMASDERIAKITCPILMLHAADDLIIPLRLGRLLYEARCKNNPLVEFVEFESHRKFGHNSIYRAVELSTILKEFLAKCEKLLTVSASS